MRCAGLQHLVGLAVLARLGTLEKILVAASALGLAETLLEELIGKRHLIVRRQEHHVGRQLVEHFLKSLLLGLHCPHRPIQFGGPLPNPCLQFGMSFVQRLLGQSALGDVANRGVPVRAIRVGGPSVALDDDARAVHAECGVFHHRLAVLADVRRYPLPVLRRDEVGDGHAFQLRHRATQHLGELLVAVHNPPVVAFDNPLERCHRKPRQTRLRSVGP